MQYSMFGKVGAKYALSSEGPYKSYMLTKDIKQFVESVLPKLWSTYFDGGITTARLENNVAHLKITGLQIKNLYFEYLIMGYFQQALKIFGKKTVAKRVRSISSGDDDVYFQYELKDF
jgi:siroheme synthase (precorrin-2 oxidase/ferrochelatase)